MFWWVQRDAGGGCEVGIEHRISGHASDLKQTANARIYTMSTCRVLDGNTCRQVIILMGVDNDLEAIIDLLQFMLSSFNIS